MTSLHPWVWVGVCVCEGGEVSELKTERARQKYSMCRPPGLVLFEDSLPQILRLSWRSLTSSPLFPSLPLFSPFLLFQSSRLITLTGEQRSVWLLSSCEHRNLDGHKHIENLYILLVSSPSSWSLVNFT